jgi:hypothetical protein
MVVLNRFPLALIVQLSAVMSFFLLLLLARSICDSSVGIVTGLPDREFPLHPRFGVAVDPAERSG